MVKARQQLYYRLKVTERRRLKDGSEKLWLEARDRYSQPRYALERRTILIFNNVLDTYLKKRPRLMATTKGNIARRFVYLAPGMRAWAQYMPGGFATYHVHNPGRLHLKNGKRLDYLTRALFRHSFDGQGLRSRAYAMTWFVHQKTSREHQLRWVSVGCGTGQPTFDAAQRIAKPAQFSLIDGSEEALLFARQLAREYEIKQDAVTTHQLHVTKNRQKLAKVIAAASPNVIDAMGLFEYLDEAAAVALLELLYQGLDKGGVLVFTNMLVTHPHLDLHQRGLGWPGVIQRSVPTMRTLIKKAAIPAAQLTVMLPDDGVYAVYGVTK